MTKTNLKTARPTGRAWAYLGATLGGLVSIAANIGHSYVPPTGAVPGWTPHSGAVVGAVFWPVALFFAVEIFARIAWPVGRTWFVLRWLGLLPVALVAAVVSYRHLSGLLAFYGEDTLTTRIGPLAVDGLMVMATGALIATGARLTATITAPALVPATADGPDVATADDASAPTVVAPKMPRPKSTRRPASATKVAKAAARMPDATVAAIAARAGVSESTARRHLPSVTPAVTVASPLDPAPAETRPHNGATLHPVTA